MDKRAEPNWDAISELRNQQLAQIINRGPRQLRENFIRAFVQQTETLLPTATSGHRAQFAHIGDLFLKMTGVDFAHERARCLLNCTEYFYRFGESFNALPYAEQALAIAKLAEAISDERRANNVLGFLYQDTSNLPRAFECLENGLRLAEQLNDRVAVCAAWENIGGAFLALGFAREAIECSERAINVSWSQTQNDLIRQLRFAAQSNIALAALHQGDIKRGLRAAEVGLQDVAAANVIQRLIFENNYVRLLLASGAVELAEERCRLAEELARPLQSIRGDLQVAIAQGLCAVYRGKHEAGLQRLKTAYQAAIQHKPAYIDVLRALVDAHQRAGEPKEALRYLQEWTEYQQNVASIKIMRHLDLLEERLTRNASLEPPLLTPEKRQSAELARLEKIAAGLRLKVLEQDLSIAQNDLLEEYAVAAELIDDNTGEHCYRVGRWAALLAEEYGCDEQTVQTIEIAARLHDLGKVGINRQILQKPSKLNAQEQAAMREHTMIGAGLLEQFAQPALQMAACIARHHHEWWNGEGYPDRLKGETIPIAARITALADVFDALTHVRPYKSAWGFADAVGEIKRLTGEQFDPDLGQLFIDLVARLQQSHGERLDGYLAASAKRSVFLNARNNILRALDKAW